MLRYKPEDERRSWRSQRYQQRPNPHLLSPLPGQEQLDDDPTPNGNRRRNEESREAPTRHHGSVRGTQRAADIE